MKNSYKNSENSHYEFFLLTLTFIYNFAPDFISFIYELTLKRDIF